MAAEVFLCRRSRRLDVLLDLSHLPIPFNTVQCEMYSYSKGWTFKAIILLGTVFLVSFFGRPIFLHYRYEIQAEKLLKELRRNLGSHSQSIMYRKRPETQHIDCQRVLQGDKPYIQSVSGKYRIPLIEDPDLDTSCEAVKSRIFPNLANQISLKPLKFPVAFARIVYMDYEFLEKQIRMSYHPQNKFCFVLDSRASGTFKKRIRNLGKCFPNVFVIDEEYPIDSSGQYMNQAHFSCMKRMITVGNWAYLITMQNHDVIGKSIFELDRILELLGGANDIGFDLEKGRLDKTLKWDLKTLKLFRNESLVPEEVLKTRANAEIVNRQGVVQGTVSREAVDWMVNSVNLEVYLDQWNQGGYGIDEQWLATFQANAFLEMPGHFTDECLLGNKHGKALDFVTRFTNWIPLDRNESMCGSGHQRHGICLLGIEDFQMIASFPNILFNKMLPSFDYSIVECMAELLHNRTYLGQKDHVLEEDYYENMVNVIYHKNHQKPGFKLNCTPSYVPWEKRILTL